MKGDQMKDIGIVKEYQELKKAFLSPRPEAKPAFFFNMTGDITDSEKLGAELLSYKKLGFGKAVFTPDKNVIPEFMSSDYFKALTEVVYKCVKAGLEPVVSIDLNPSETEGSGIAGGKFSALYPEQCTQVLEPEEYICSEKESVKRPIKKDGKLMSVLAFDIEAQVSVDLRAFIDGDTLEWDAPEGNWNIYFFYCRNVKEPRYVNYLHYTSSLHYIELCCKPIADMKRELDVRTGTDNELAVMWNDIRFTAENRRDWDERFNDYFMDEYGYDPAPYYHALFYDIGKDTDHYKAQLTDCRNRMLLDGFYKAMSDYSKSHALRTFGTPAIPKAIPAPSISGDPMLCHKKADAACTEMAMSYMYGLNGVKLAASAAYNFDISRVICDIYRDYSPISPEIMKREAMNVLARGANSLYMRDIFKNDIKMSEAVTALNEAVTRAQSLLRIGHHCADIALLYPIYSLDAQTYMYYNNVSGFDYPVNPVNADFMNVINSLMNYSYCDLTVIHPDIMQKKCYTENGVLYMNNAVNSEQFKVLILPGSTMISIENLRLIRKFYDGGGYVIATGELPSAAFEYDDSHLRSCDEELAQILTHIFGERSIADPSLNFMEYTSNRNEAGGRAFLLYPSMTAADGTYMTSSQKFDTILDKLDMSWDVYFDNKLKVENSGVLSLYFPQFRAMHLERGIAGGGLFNYIHRKSGFFDILFISNTTDADYDGTVSVRGRLLLESWDPVSGKIRRLPAENTIIKGEAYTKTAVSIEAASALFIIGQPDRK